MTKTLVDSRGKENPCFLYVEAAGNTDENLKNGFVGNVQKNLGNVSCEALNLYLRAQNSEEVTENYICRLFEKADVIFFEGGDIITLTELFGKYGLKDLCCSAFERGAAVGGICGGGLMLLDQIIYKNPQDRVTVMSGVGLVPQTVASCYVDCDFTGVDRQQTLQELSSEMSQAIGLRNDQTVIFNSDGTYCLEENPADDPLAYLVRAEDKKKKPVPVVQESSLTF